MPISRHFQRFDGKTLRLFLLFLCLAVCYVSSSQEAVTRQVPLLHSSNDSFTGVLRFINHSKAVQDVSIVGIDDEGTEYGPVSFTIGSQENKLIYADDLENGSDDIEDSFGRGVGSWRLEIAMSPDVETTAYAEAQDGLLESLHQTVRGENGCWRVPTFYSADNLTTSKLRLTNPNSDAANIKISGRDDRGTISASPIQLTLAPMVTQSFSASDLEDGTDDFEGLLGNGRGNWQLAIESDRLITVMNLIEGDRSVSNVSSRPTYAIGHCWLGNSLANADRSIGKLLEVFVAPERLEETAQITPAIYAAIVDETGVRAVAAKGVKKIGTDSEASIHDRLYLGSITKPMAATMIATLIYDEESVFSDGWNTTLAEIFSDVIDDIHEDYHEVEVKEILTHISGIHPNLPLFEDDVEQSMTERRLKATMATLALVPAGERGTVTYSHVSYTVMASIAEKLTGTSWETLMQERLFAPLGMSSAGFGPPALLDEDKEAWGHTLTVENEWVPTTDDWHELLIPSAGVHASMADLGKFLQLWMDDKEPMLLTRPQIRELVRLAVDDEGRIPIFNSLTVFPSAGWWWSPVTFPLGEALNAPGSNGNWSALVWVMRAISRAYLVVVNSALPADRYTDFGTQNQVLTPTVNSLARSPARSEPPKLPSSELKD
ncbi:MAG: serine hydrolase [Gammaproteobacteria bacterium]|nr:serine hydrolase [Gammaproteobacteria bacterium]